MTNSFVIVPERGGAPKQISAGTPEDLMKQLWSAIITTKRGWCFITLNGVPARLSLPQQRFTVRDANNKEYVVESGDGVGVAEDGAFSILVTTAD